MWFFAYFCKNYQMVINNVQSLSFSDRNTRCAIRPRWIAIGAVAYAAACAVMLAVMPNRMYWQGLAALLAMGAVAAGVYSRMSWRSAGGWAVLAVAATAVATLISVNWYYFANVGGTGLDNPGLLYDPARSWRGALYMAGYHDVEPVDDMFLGHISVVWACIKLFGRSVIAPMAVNGTAILLGGIFTGSLAARLIPSRQGAAYAGMWGMIIIFAVAAFLYMSALMTKDALLCCAVPAFARAMVDIRRPKWLAVAVVAIVTVIWLRTSMASMMLLGVILMCPCFNWRRDSVAIAVVVATIIAMYVLERSLAMGIAVQDMGQANIGLMADNHKGSNQDVWLSVINRDGGLHIWQQLIVFPAGILVQFLIPFPWDLSGGEHLMGYAATYYRFAFPWYIIGGLILYYIAKGWRRSTKPLKFLYLWAAICWLAPAYMLGGTVSRYGTPFAPILVLGAVYVVLNLRHDKSLRRWMWIFCVLMAAGLTACYLIMKNYAQNI